MVMAKKTASANEAAKTDTARRIVGLVDLTSLGDSDTERDVIDLCANVTVGEASVASVCIWPQFVSLAVEKLEGSGVPVCAVANFPEGDNDPERAVADALGIVQAGGSEVDVVIPWRALRSGERGAARRLVSAVRDAVGSSVTIKAILESGELADQTLVGVAGREAIAGGANFLKTSTGKTTTSATLEAAKTLLELVRDHSAATGDAVGVKISGGVRTVDQARDYLDLADSIMGPEWVEPMTFRFGASSLLADIRTVLDVSRSE